MAPVAKSAAYDCLVLHITGRRRRSSDVTAFQSGVYPLFGRLARLKLLVLYEDLVLELIWRRQIDVFEEIGIEHHRLYEFVAENFLETTADMSD